MSNWQVHLTFSEGSSSKFWRARVEGSTLYVNYGRMGAGGQTQVKTLASAELAEKELGKLEREKRKKGYEDASDEGERAPAVAGDDEAGAAAAGDDGAPEDGEEEAAPPRPPPSAPPARQEQADYGLELEGRRLELRLSRDGSVVRTVVMERYASDVEALAAFQRLQAQVIADGYHPLAAHDPGPRDG